MLNIRTSILSATLLGLFIFTVGLVTVRSDVVSDRSREVTPVTENLGETMDLWNANSAPSYRSQFGECFDVSLKDLSACRDESQATMQAQNFSVDECFDVSISELTSCRNASQAPAP